MQLKMETAMQPEDLKCLNQLRETSNKKYLQELKVTKKPVTSIPMLSRGRPVKLGGLDAIVQR